MDLKIFDAFFTACAAAAFIVGVYQFKNQKLVGRKDFDDSKEEIKKFAKIEGILYMAIGFGGVLTAGYTLLGTFPYFTYWIGWAIVLGGVIIDAVLSKKYLK